MPALDSVYALLLVAAVLYYYAESCDTECCTSGIFHLPVLLAVVGASVYASCPCVDWDDMRQNRYPHKVLYIVWDVVFVVLAASHPTFASTDEQIICGAIAVTTWIVTTPMLLLIARTGEPPVYLRGLNTFAAVLLGRSFRKEEEAGFGCAFGAAFGYRFSELLFLTLRRNVP